nr:MAG TPA: hypothetical protein [Caudoviricetes sp.]
MEKVWKSIEMYACNIHAIYKIYNKTKFKSLLKPH